MLNRLVSHGSTPLSYLGTSWQKLVQTALPAAVADHRERGGEFHPFNLVVEVVAGPQLVGSGSRPLKLMSSSSHGVLTRAIGQPLR